MVSKQLSDFEQDQIMVYKYYNKIESLESPLFINWFFFSQKLLKTGCYQKGICGC